MVTCNAVLILTAFGLYYLGAETLRPWASDVHMVAGFALPVLITIHIWLGRRQSKNRVARLRRPPVSRTPSNQGDP
jgi:hypothetical protein